ncbi:MAG TPA: molybdopterin molybdenumtransferase MoeA [Chloroflexus aurantiacus]|jgi:molybdopterin molybdotransferase|uniref:Molybdopterin molybdenumtransferase n=1 Tax=Chloroflexus aurantiacus (strain ATCC 29366 / DSM 635 / J-10-fl) TaxID=324602 RepID=A9WF01_CHLAA|nr:MULTISPECIES: gephyrin-like molybdotransferase Glp [Chloroflexus]ABY35316.1 molybdenum cofactor synthesis domain protein [Chloroflexus aurantiacus J-10-fl]RMG45997.1 MAG: molybdopterin molybdenumtransferase MoeA [Chloroflexota bacterium]GIV92269.1 MAG: molybdopterin molybdenumtransferase MoeA [Chloroflexus sp.]HBW66492.1 molybdopterin molybdenumtransferase MoeA [Chloroflexus aurantiacus]
MAEMLRESPYPMVSIAEATATIMAQARPLASEEIEAFSALGRVLAGDITSPEDIPDVPKSAMDGYALRAADGLTPRRVVGELTAGGAAAVMLAPGEATRIMTGAPLPPGADAMIPVELTTERDGMLYIQRELQPGDYVHVVGQDVRRGQTVLTAGTTIGAAEIGILATLGITRIPVYRQPRVAILATGDEVVEPGSPRPAGAVRDSNRYALMAAVREAGGIPISLGIARDDRDVQRQAILHGLDQADVLITSGGVSMGTRDLIKPLLAELGTVHFGRIAFKPGKPTTFATIGGKLVFGLPGYPVSSLVSFEVFVRPALRALQGDASPFRPQIEVTLAEPVRPSPDRPEYQRIIVRYQEGRFTAVTTGSQSSSRLLSLRGANGLLLVPAGDTVYPAGSTLPALLTGPLIV